MRPATLTIIAVGGLGLAAATSATAQTILRSPQEVSACLCREAAVNTLGSDVAARRTIYEQRRQELERLEAELAAMRQKMNVNNPEEVAAYARLFDQRNAALDAFSRAATPDYAAIVERYNQRVAEYNSTCAGKAYDTVVLATVRQSLSCPAP